jgi:AraC-like DNA-binding protein
MAYRILIEQKGKPVSLKEIAYRCGFNDSTQLTKAFKGRFGITPKEAREAKAPLPLQSEGGTLVIHEHLSSQAKKVVVI